METATTQNEWLISVDDHVLEPSHLWQTWVPRRYRDAAPRLVRDSDGEAWIYDGKRMVTPGLGAVAGKTREEFSFEPITYDEMRPGCYDSVARSGRHGSCRSNRLSLFPFLSPVLWASVL